MQANQQLLASVVEYNKYAKYIPSLKRRETWNEIMDRYEAMMIQKYPKLKDDILNKMPFLRTKKVLPSMRMLQFAGPAIEKNHARGYNCSYLPLDDYRAFSELMFLLLGGTGVGYSVQKNHVNKLPSITQPTRDKKYLIGDSIEGWADAVKALMKSYMGKTSYRPRFDYSDIRPKGARLVTAGGKAPGPEPLRICLTKIDSLLREIPNGESISPLQAHDIACYIADAVLAGGIRRAALISLFSKDDEEMLGCKSGSWWELNPQRGRANNSAVMVRGRAQKEDFDKLWGYVKNSGSGEPGIYWTNDPDYGTNPCCEISLRPFTFCNLTEINAGVIRNQDDLNKAAGVASFFGTLQAGFTDFHYLRPIWKRNTIKDSLIGVGITGIGNGTLIDLDLTEASGHVSIINRLVADEIGIPVAARNTTIKPAGTTSCVVGTSSGAHAWHAEYYIRNMQCRVGDDLYEFFNTHHSELIQIMDYDPMSAVIGIPQKAPDTAILRENESALDFLERVLRYNLKWVKKGHLRGPNTNNVSATCSIREDEWDVVGKWMWDHRNDYNGMSVLPYDNGTYRNAPFEVCSREVYEAKMKYIQQNPIDLTLIREDEDNTARSLTVACSGGKCDV